MTLVTGGASGLGRGTVERFIKQGGKVVIGDLPSSKGNDLAKELGDSAVFVPLDVGSASLFYSVESVMQMLESYQDLCKIQLYFEDKFFPS